MPFIIRKTVSETFLERVRTTPDFVGFQFKPTHPEMGPVGHWRKMTYREYEREVQPLAYGLMSFGLKKGDRVAILSNTRIEWSLADIAILGASCVTVPIYASNLPVDVAYILDHSEAQAAFVENEAQLEKILTYRLENPIGLPHLKKIILMDPTGHRPSDGKTSPESSSPEVLSFHHLQELGRREQARNPQQFEQNLTSALPSDLMTICYTSGTTGVPKGVMLTHDNMMSVIDDCIQSMKKYCESEKEVVVSFLPYSHVIGKVESLATYAFGWRHCYAEGLDHLITNIGEIKPTLLFSVPRIFEKAYTRIHAMVDAGPAIKKKLFDWAIASGRRYYSAIWADRTPAMRDRIEYHLAQKLVLDKIAVRFGGELRYAFCGGAPLSQEIAEFFRIVGITIMEAYGLTETCAPVTLNTPAHCKYGTVGRPLPEVTLKIGEDGEILVKSRKVFLGYYKMPEETARTMEGGWFHTGDVGRIDHQGFLKITDRIKDLIITSGGKNVAPQKIENLAKAHKIISQFVVHGDRRNYLTALATLDKEQVVEFAKAQQILFSDYKELIHHQKVIALVQRVVDEVNSQLASYETVKKFVILPNDFSVESGELTPSLKVKRNLLNQRYQAEFDSMYREPKF
jgi:long-chain acyl-CoA synthetase